MSFDMKYDKHGNPVKDTKVLEQIEQQSQETETVQQEAAEVEQSETEVAEQPQEQPQKPVSTAPQESFRELRYKAEQAERERDELRRRLLDMEQQKSAYQTQPQPVEDDEINIAPDDLAEGKHLTKVGRKIKKLEDQLRQQQQQTNAAIIEAKLKTQYPDFDSIVCRDNLDRLRNEFPEMAETIINSSADLYSKGVSAYSVIKKLGISTENTSFEKEKTVVKQNSVKPRPVVSLSPQQGESPLHKANAFANGMTEELKLQLRKEMEDARRNR